MVVADLARHLALHQIARALEIEHEHAAPASSEVVHPLALARAVALAERRQHAERGEEAGREIADRDADAHRPAPGLAGDRHQPAHALRDLIDAGPVAIGPVLAEARDAGIDEPLVDRLQRLVIDAEAELDVGAVILDQDVGALDQAAEDGEAVGMLQVDRDAALVAVEVLEIGIVARGEIGLGAGVGIALAHLDLDDAGAPIGELARAGGAGARPRQVEDGEALQRARGRCVAHVGVPSRTPP